MERENYCDEPVNSQQQNVVQRASEEQVWNGPENAGLVVIDLAGAIATVVDVDHDWNSNSAKQNVDNTKASDDQVGDCVEFSIKMDGNENQNVSNNRSNNDDNIEKENDVKHQTITHEAVLEVLEILLEILQIY